MRKLINITLTPICILSMLFVIALASGEVVHLERPNVQLRCVHCGDAPLDIYNHIDVCDAHTGEHSCAYCNTIKK